MIFILRLLYYQKIVIHAHEDIDFQKSLDNNKVMEEIKIKFVVPSLSETTTWKDIPLDTCRHLFQNKRNSTLKELLPELERLAPYLPILDICYFQSVDHVIDFYQNYKTLTLDHKLYQNYSGFIVIENDIIDESADPNSLLYDFEKWKVKKLLIENSKLFDQLNLSKLPNGNTITLPREFIDLINSSNFHIALMTEFEFPIKKYLELDALTKENIDAIAATEYLYCTNFLDFICPIDSSSVIEEGINKAKIWVLSTNFEKPNGIRYKEQGLAYIDHYSYSNPGVRVVLDREKIKIHNEEDFIEGEMMLAFDYHDGYFVIPMQAFRNEENGIPLKVPKELVLDDDKRKYVIAYSHIKDRKLTGKPCPIPKPLKMNIW